MRELAARSLAWQAERKFLAGIGVSVVYLIASTPLAIAAGPVSNALSLIPVIGWVWFFGLRAGVLASVTFFFLHLARSWILFGLTPLEFLSPAVLIGHGSLVLVAALVAIMRFNSMRLQTLSEEYRRAELALRDSENRYEAAVLGANDVIWDTNLLTGSTYRSSRWHEMLGYAPDYNPTRLEEPDLIHPDDRARFHQLLDEHLAGNSPFLHSEHRIRTAAGDYKWVLARGRAEFDEAGHAIRIAGSTADITQRKEAERDLLLSEARTRALLESVPDLTVRVTADGTILEVLSAEDFDLTATRGALPGRNFRDFIPAAAESAAPGLSDRMAQAIVEAIRDQENRTLAFAVPSTARPTCYFEVRLSPYAGDELLALVRDMTDQRQAEESLRASRRDFRTLVDQMPDGVLITRDNRILLANDAAARMLGYSSPDALLEIEALSLLHPEEWESATQRVTRVMAGEQVQSIERRYLRADGSTIFLELAPLTLVEMDGLLAVMASLRDTTERRQAEIALRASEERYERVIEGANDGIWDWDVKTGHVFRSERWHEMLGYKPGDIPPTMETAATFTHPDDVAAARKMLDEVGAGLTDSFSHEHRLRTQSGDYIWVLSRGRNFRDDAGRVVRVAGSTSDISARKEAEEAVRHGHDQLRALMDNSPDLIYFKDTESRYVRINPAEMRALGLSDAEDAVGRREFDFADPADRPQSERIREADQALIATGKPSLGVERLRRWPGEEEPRWVLTNKIPLIGEDGVVSGFVGITRDITDQKKTEIALEESEQRHRALVESAADGILTANAEGRIVSVNPAGARILGRTASELTGLPLLSIVPQDLRYSLAASYLSSPPIEGQVEGGILGKTLDLTVLRGDGTEIPVELTLSHYAAAGESYFSAILRDVGERRRNEQALKDSADRIANQAKRLKLLGSISALIASRATPEEIEETCLDGVFQVIDCQRTDIIRLDAESGQHVLTAERGMASDLKLGDPIPDGRPQNAILRGEIDSLLATPGSESWASSGMASLAAVAIRVEGKTIGILGAAAGEPDAFDEFDIELLAAIAAQVGIALETGSYLETVTNQTARLRLLTHISSLISSKATPVDIQEVCVDGVAQVVACDHAMITSLDRESGELIATSERGVLSEQPSNRVIPPDSPPGAVVFQKVDSFVGRPPEGFQSELGMESVAVVPIRANGDVVGTLSCSATRSDAFTDFDVELLRSLADHVGASLEAAESAASRHESERLRVLGQLSAGVAHHINNQAAAVEFARGSVLPDADPSQFEMLETVQSTNQGIAATVRRIREYVGTAQRETVRRIDIVALAEDAIELTRTHWSTEARPSGQQIHLRTSLGEPVFVMAPHEQLLEVVMNLIINATESLPYGGSIAVAVDTAAGQAQLHVTDDGIGMDEAIQKRIFEPFFTTKGSSGEGLGLGTAQTIVRQLGGDLTVTSSPGQGAKFTVQLALSTDDPPAPVPIPIDAIAPSIAGQTILVVDDEPLVRSALRQLLIRRDCDVSEAEDGEQALEIFPDHNFDAVLCDLKMPGIDGWEVAARINEINPDCPTVILTGFVEHFEHSESRHPGVTALLTKPCTSRELVDTLVHAIGPPPEADA